MSALCQKQTWAASLDHLVGRSEQIWWNGKAERLGGVEIDHKLKLAGPHNWQVGRFLAFENPAGVDAALTVCLGNARSVAHKAAGFGKLTQGIDRKDPMVSR